MTPEQARIDEEMALLLDLDVEERGGMLPAARERLRNDAAFRAEYTSLARVGERLEALGDRFDDAAGPIDIVEAVRDSIAHLAFEELAVAQASPYSDVEQALRDLKTAFDDSTGAVSIVDDVMEAVAAGHKSDEDMERPFARETARLHSLGEAISARAPEVALVKPVRDEVARRKPANVVPLRARAAASTVRVSPERNPWPSVAGWVAAVAVFAAGAWFFMAGNGLTDPRERFVEVHPPEIKTPAVPEVDPDREPVAVAKNPDDAAPQTDPAPDGARKVSEGDTPPLTLQEVITARRRDLVNDTRAIAALASMTEEDAIALLREMDLSVEALIGATQFLSTEEAISVLRAAIADNPEDPHLRLALARSLGDDPETANERIGNLTQMAAADANNGLPYFMIASEYFARGEADLGLDALSRGSAFEESSAYALEGVQQHEAALIANGTPPDVARLLAISMAGESEYYDVGELRSELLDYGAQYEELGDFETAQQIYNAVNQLGQQLATGADMAIERQSGLETQHEAVLAIQGIAEALQDPEIVAWLGDSLNSLVSGIVDIAGYIQARQQLILNPSITNEIDWSGYLEHVIRNGDLDITQYLPE